MATFTFPIREICTAVLTSVLPVQALYGTCPLPHTSVRSSDRSAGHTLPDMGYTYRYQVPVRESIILTRPHARIDSSHIVYRPHARTAMQFSCMLMLSCDPL